MQRRHHPRVRLRLPARLRWSAPLGQLTEQCETINASRGGLLLECAASHAAGNPLWVAFPLDPEASMVQPETLAKVMRCDVAARDGEAPVWHIALAFEFSPHSGYAGNGKGAASTESNGGGKNIALPIRVRQQHTPWYEEAMTLYAAPDRLKFLTHREYAFGERLKVSFASNDEAPVSGAEEWEAEVTGIEMEAGNDSLLITLRKRPE